MNQEVCWVILHLNYILVACERFFMITLSTKCSDAGWLDVQTALAHFPFA